MGVLKLKKHCSYAKKNGRIQLIDFGVASISNPELDIGALMIDVDCRSDADYNNCLRTYWEALNARLRANRLDQGMTFEQFQLFTEVVRILRRVFYLALVFDSLPNDERNQIRDDYTTNPPFGL